MSNNQSKLTQVRELMEELHGWFRAEASHEVSDLRREFCIQYAGRCNVAMADLVLEEARVGGNPT